ncbi:Os02g0658651, partial [Oryza sativa Japonica Group]
VHDGPVRAAGLPPGGDDVAGDERPAGAGREADGHRRLQRRRPGVVLPHRAPRLLHRRPRSAAAAAAALHEVHRRQVAVAVLVLDQHGEVVLVGAGVHPERDVHPLPFARHPAHT